MFVNFDWFANCISTYTRLVSYFAYSKDPSTQEDFYKRRQEEEKRSWWGNSAARITAGETTEWRTWRTEAGWSFPCK